MLKEHGGSERGWSPVRQVRRISCKTHRRTVPIHTSTQEPSTEKHRNTGAQELSQYTQAHRETQKHRSKRTVPIHTNTEEHTETQEHRNYSNTHKHTGTQEHGAHEHRKTQEHRDTLTIPINTGSTPASPRHLLLE